MAAAAGAPGARAVAPGGWFDSHCHLQEKYLGDADADSDTDAGADTDADADTDTDTTAPGHDVEAVAQVLRRAVDAGVGSLVCVGTDAATSSQALALAAGARAGALGPGLPGIWATAGLHPHQASSGTGAVARVVAEAVGVGGGGALVAVGECGLDYHYDHSPRHAQRTAFAEQIALAHQYGLALVIHAREAWGDLFDVLAAEGVPERTVLHCFTGGPAEARRCLDAGMFVSFSGIVTFKSAPEVREAAALCPLDRLLVETDSPFLAPAPHRGKPNEPAFVPLVGAVVAEVKGLGAAEVAHAATAATAAVFGL